MEAKRFFSFSKVMPSDSQIKAFRQFSERYKNGSSSL